MEKKVFVLCARRWFDKLNGNSYYSLAVVHPDGDKETLTGFTYGHGYATYIHHATEFLKGLYTSLNFETDVRFVVDETEVMRKKDLHKVGR
jgi:hypothetical protein